CRRHSAHRRRPRPTGSAWSARRLSSRSDPHGAAARWRDDHPPQRLFLAGVLGSVGLVHFGVGLFVVHVLDRHGIAIGAVDEGGVACALDAAVPLRLGAVGAADVWHTVHYDRPDRGHDLTSVPPLSSDAHGVRPGEVVDRSHGWAPSGAGGRWGSYPGATRRPTLSDLLDE